ncbi:thioredoxin family protein [Thiorhodococcus minor]|uniref:Thioredoxin family protein n=1 Tax=Thiorhodococcus minor TaxID=57489 RepID=A0A6M0JVE7_9GAMM|nr:thioredoxin family protein [Thiorhodococcus minor]NEV61149.1 thioredoxin family protein [Thiorhodococcus minor]
MSLLLTRSPRAHATMLILIGLLLTGSALAKPEVGAPAPAFTGTDTSGQSWRLADLHGKTVVLEWTNHDCPYVRKHYGSGNMQALQREAAGNGVLWLSVISSAPGKQGYVSPAEADALTRQRDASPTAVLLDPEGTMGRAYGAQTTPHLFVIDGSGTLVYMGGIDDRPTTDPADIAGATNYVRAALADLAAGESLGTPVARPYGCSVKY